MKTYLWAGVNLQIRKVKKILQRKRTSFQHRKPVIFMYVALEYVDT